MSRALFLAIVLMLGCGVKRDPVPPEVPRDFGSGKPTYKTPDDGGRASDIVESELEEKDDEEEAP